MIQFMMVFLLVLHCCFWYVPLPPCTIKPCCRSHGIRERSALYLKTPTNYLHIYMYIYVCYTYTYSRLDAHSGLNSFEIPMIMFGFLPTCHRATVICNGILRFFSCHNQSLVILIFFFNWVLSSVRPISFFSYRLIPIKYRYHIFHIGWYR